MDRIGDLLERPGALEPRADAIRAPGRLPLTHGELGELVSGVAGGLRASGFGGGSRVALLVGNGPEAACAFLALTQAAAVAPLNPAYRAQELAFYLEDIRADAVVVDARLDTPAREVARELGIGVLELTVDPSAPAGVFGIDGVFPGVPFDDRPDPDAVALLLHTSGTTARPKIVPLTHRQLRRERDERRADARPDARGPLPQRDAAVPHPRPRRRAPRLAAGGRLRGLRARASIRCTSSTGSTSSKPTWYTAVPTMHAAVLARAPDHAETRRAPPAALHPLVLGGAAPYPSWTGSRRRSACRWSRPTA